MNNKTYKKMQLQGWSFTESKYLRKKIHIFILEDERDNFNKRYRYKKNKKRHLDSASLKI